MRHSGSLCLIIRNFQNILKVFVSRGVGASIARPQAPKNIQRIRRAAAAGDGWPSGSMAVYVRRRRASIARPQAHKR